MFQEVEGSGLIWSFPMLKTNLQTCSDPKCSALPIGAWGINVILKNRSIRILMIFITVKNVFNLPKTWHL